MRACLSALDLQHRPVVVQVAGTNGKGSTCQFIASVARAAGYRVGVFSSPHLVTVRERFTLDEGPVSVERFMAAYQAVREEVGELTFFEQMTALAAWIFDDAKVDLAIYEVGLGGRLDSTSALRADLTLVSGIGLDHEEFLGSTLEAIASEKAGIFREGVPAIIGMSAPHAIREQLVDMARATQAPAHLVGAAELARVPEELCMCGPHQRANAALALAACDALVGLGMAIPEPALSEGLRNARLAGRFERIESDLWIDGAHNGQAALALALLLAEEASLDPRPWVLVVGLSREKRIAEFLAPLVGLCTAIYATSASNERAQSAAAIAEAARQAGAARVECVQPGTEALREARKNFPGHRILVTGSLLLLGELLAELGHGDPDPLPLSDPSAPRPPG